MAWIFLEVVLQINYCTFLRIQHSEHAFGAKINSNLLLKKGENHSRPVAAAILFERKHYD